MDFVDWVNAIGGEICIYGSFDPRAKNGFINAEIKVNSVRLGLEGGRGSLFGRSGSRPTSEGYKGGYPTVDEAIKDLCACVRGRDVSNGEGFEISVPDDLTYNPTKLHNPAMRRTRSG